MVPVHKRPVTREKRATAAWSLLGIDDCIVASGAVITVISP